MVTKEAEKAEILRAIFRLDVRYTPAGTYTCLMYKRDVIMSDTPDEIDDHMEAIHHASGHCLINGLGLGVVVNAILQKPDVEMVTVIEKSKDVIGLVAPHYLRKFGNSRLEIINVDAFDYQPPKNVRYGMVWHDIWPTICADNLPEMHKLHRKYGRHAVWQGSWCRRLCERDAR